MTEQTPPSPEQTAGSSPPPADPGGPAFGFGGGATSPVPGPLATQTFMPQRDQPPPMPQAQFGAPPPPPPGYGPPQGPPPGYGPPPQGGPPPGYPPPPPGYAPPPPGYAPPPPQGFGAPPMPGYAAPGYPQAPGFPGQPGYPGSYGQQPFGLTPYAGGAPMAGPLATGGKRFLASLLRLVLVLVTLVIGYLIWTMILWSKGLTPEYKIMKLQVVKKDTGQPATWGTMFLRGFVGYGIVQGILNSLLIGYVLMFMMFWDKDRQQIYDKMAGTVVLDLSGTIG